MAERPRYENEDEKNIKHFIFSSGNRTYNQYNVLFELEVHAVSAIGIYSDTGWIGKRIL